VGAPEGGGALAAVLGGWVGGEWLVEWWRVRGLLRGGTSAVRLVVGCVVAGDRALLGRGGALSGQY